MRESMRKLEAVANIEFREASNPADAQLFLNTSAVESRESYRNNHHPHLTNEDIYSSYVSPTVTIQNNQVIFDRVIVNMLYSNNHAQHNHLASEGIRIHELLHALGLRHSSPLSDREIADRSDRAPYVSELGLSPSPDWFTTANGYLEGRYYKHHQLFDTTVPYTPAVGSIAALQALYGANLQTGSGRNIYPLTGQQSYAHSVWDSGDTDIIDARGARYPARIYLESGLTRPSRVGYESLFLADGVAIEAAFGGLYNDVINVTRSQGELLAGGAGYNRLSGFGGNDILYANDGRNRMIGGSGADRFMIHVQNRATQPDGKATVHTVVDFNPAEGDQLLLVNTGAWGANGLNNMQVFLEDQDTVITLPSGEIIRLERFTDIAALYNQAFFHNPKSVTLESVLQGLPSTSQPVLYGPNITPVPYTEELTRWNRGHAGGSHQAGCGCCNCIPNARESTEEPGISNGRH